jgi:hypothetical protein
MYFTLDCTCRKKEGVENRSTWSVEAWASVKEKTTGAVQKFNGGVVDNGNVPWSAVESCCQSLDRIPKK